MLELKGITKEQVKIGDYVFEVKALSRKQVLEYLSKVMEITGGKDLTEVQNPQQTDDLAQMLIEFSVSDEKAKQLINELPTDQFVQLVNFIMDISGMGGQEKKV